MVTARNRRQAPLLSPVRPAPEGGKAQVLAAATRLFAAHGFDGTALQDIADAVGMSKPAVLHHYPSKEHLRVAVLEDMLAHWTEALPRLLLAATAGDMRFDAVLSELVTFFASDPDRARILVRECLDRPEQVRGLLLSHVKPWVTAIAEYIRKGQRHGEHFEDADPEVYLLHVFQLTVSAIASQQAFGVLVPEIRGEGSVDTRYLKELRRIAKSSLFPAPVQPSALPQPPETAKPPRIKKRA